MRPVVIPPKVKLLGMGFTLCSLQYLLKDINPQHQPGMLALSGMLTVTSSLLTGKVSKFQEAFSHRHKQQTGKELVNHDLTRLVGEAIAAILAAIAPDNEHHYQLLSLSDAVRDHWVTYVTNQEEAVYFADKVNLTPVSEEGLIELFSTDREAFNKATTLTPEEWGTILRSLVADKDTGAFEDAIAVASAALPDSFANAVREKLKADAASDGKAYAALQLNVMGELFAVCKNLEQQKQSLTPEVQAELRGLETRIAGVSRELIGQIDARFDQLSKEQKEWFTSTRETFHAYGLTLGAIHETVGRVERHTEQIPAIGETVADILRRVQQLAVAPQQSDKPAGVFFNVPDVQEGFIGRRDVLERLHIAFQSSDAAQWRQVVVGTAGLGKTAVALASCHEYRAHYPSLFWVNADSEANLETDFISAAKHLNLYVKDTRDDRAYYVAMQHWFGDKTNYLLVLDNVEDYRMVARALPDGANGRLLVTSRRQDVEPLGGAVMQELGIMERNEATAFLLYRAGRDGQNQENVAEASDLAHALGDLPLALEHAGAYLKWHQNVSFRAYLDDFRQRKLAVFPQPDSRDADLRATVVTAWNKNLEAVFGYQGIKGLLLSSSFLAPDDIPEDFARAYFSNNAASVAPALQMLQNYSLVRWQKTEQTYSLHRLLQEVLRAGVPDATQHGYLITLTQKLEKLFSPPNSETWPQCERWLPHILMFAQFVNAHNLKSEKAGVLLYRVSLYLYQRGRYAAADPLLKTLEEKEKELGVAHLDMKQLAAQALSDNNPQTALSLNNLAELYRVQGRYDEAEPLYVRALAIREQVLGPQHPDTAQSLNNLALLYDTQSRYDEAEPLYERALAIREQVLGPQHPDTATSLNNLAALYYAQSRYDEAEPLFVRALAIREQVLGPQHPDTAQSLNNLAALYRVQGRYDEAEPLYVRALAICEQVLGPQHPDTATSLNNLAGLYYAQSRYDEAEPLYVRALAIREQVLGPQHPDTATSLNNLAELYRVQGRYDEAEPLFVRALAICEQVLGPQHPDTATSLNNLAGLYYAQSRYDEAEPLLRRVVEIMVQVLGLAHPDVALYMKNLAILLHEMGREDEAQKYRNRAAEVQAAHERLNAAPSGS